MRKDKKISNANKAMAPPKGLHILFLGKKLPVLLPDIAKMITPAIIRKCFEQAKMKTVVYGPSRRHFEMDVDRNSRLQFVEFMLFLCMISKVIYSQNNKLSNEVYNTNLRDVLKALIGGKNGMEFEEVPLDEED